MAHDDLEARVRRLEEVESARGMFNIYAETLDVPDASAVATLFTDSGVLHTALGTFTGRPAIEEFYRKAFAADPSVKRHFVVNPRVVEATPGIVRLKSYFLYVGRGTRSIIGWGTYDDVVDVSGAQPRFREKTITVHLGTDLAAGWAAEEDDL